MEIVFAKGFAIIYCFFSANLYKNNKFAKFFETSVSILAFLLFFFYAYFYMML